MHNLAVGTITGNKVTCVLEVRCVHAACERSGLRAFVRLSVQVLTHLGFRSQLSGGQRATKFALKSRGLLVATRPTMAAPVAAQKFQL